MELGKEYALTGATVIDGNGGPPQKNTTVVVKNGVIEYVGGWQSANLTGNIQKVDTSEYHLMPGLIDCQVHFTGDSGDDNLGWLAESTLLKAIRSVDEARRVLDVGFTTVKSCGSRYDIYLKRAIEEGMIIGPRILACGLQLHRTWGSEDDIRRDIFDIPEDWAQQNANCAQPCDGVEEIRKAIRKLLGQNVDHIVFCATGGDTSEKDRLGDMHYSMAEMKTIVEEAHMVGLGVMCYARNLQAIKDAIELGVQTIKYGDTPEGEELDEETCKKMAEKNIYLNPTLSVYFVDAWAVEEIPKHILNGWKRAMKNGVKMLLGSDPYSEKVTPFGKTNIGEIKYLVDLLEMTPLEAITSGTKYGAEDCGIADKVGTIEKGKLADLLVVKGDPSSNVDVLLDKENIKYIIKEGNLVIEH